jgi:cytochrome c oxidase subunit 1
MIQQKIGTVEPQFTGKDRNLILAHFVIAYFSLFIGILAGIVQVLQRTGIITLPGAIGYYQILTIHGIYLALGLTTFFIFGFLYASMAKVIGGSLVDHSRKLAWIGFFVMLLGVLMVTVEVLANRASVLYTFYAPLGASPAFYIGVTFLITGS